MKKIIVIFALLIGALSVRNAEAARWESTSTSTRTLTQITSGRGEFYALICGSASVSGNYAIALDTQVATTDGIVGLGVFTSSQTLHPPIVLSTGTFNTTSSGDGKTSVATSEWKL